MKKRPLPSLSGPHANTLRVNSTAAAVAAAAAAAAASSSAQSASNGERRAASPSSTTPSSSSSAAAAGGSHPEQLLLVSSSLNTSQMMQYFGNCTKEIPGFPRLAVPEAELPAGVTAALLEEFVSLYKKHCGQIFEAVMMLNFTR